MSPATKHEADEQRCDREEQVRTPTHLNDELFIVDLKPL